MKAKVGFLLAAFLMLFSAQGAVPLCMFADPWKNVSEVNCSRFYLSNDNQIINKINNKNEKTIIRIYPDASAYDGKCI